MQNEIPPFNEESPFPPRENFTPIFCSRCGSLNLAFVTEYHKAIGLKILCLLLALGIIGSIVGAILAKEITILIVTFILFFIWLACQIIVYDIESKTHVQCICRDCGNVWLHN